MVLISISSVSDFRQNCYNMMAFLTVVENKLYCGKDFGHINHL